MEVSSNTDSNENTVSLFLDSIVSTAFLLIVKEIDRFDCPFPTKYTVLYDKNY